ncbi:hypothetical protein VTI74DRAFT_2601 [Chaetomium olivicolor]
MIEGFKPTINLRRTDGVYEVPISRPSEDGMMSEPFISGTAGYAFHAACWSLLEGALHPAPVPLPRLLNVCRSFPIPPTLSTIS